MIRGIRKLSMNQIHIYLSVTRISPKLFPARVDSQSFGFQQQFSQSFSLRTEPGLMFQVFQPSTQAFSVFRCVVRRKITRKDHRHK